MVEMQQNQLPITPDQVIDILLRRKWLVIVPLCIALTGGLFMTFYLPRTYFSSTTILVQAQRVPGEYVKSIVSTGISERISTISQQIMSRTNLEKIIDQFGLFETPDSRGVFLEDKIKSLRRKINVKLSRAKGSASSFKISYTGTEPERVMRIANTLASFFMDENLKLREAQAVGTSEFLNSELEKTRKMLIKREQKLSDYRAKYLGGLPDELDSNLRTLDRLQLQLTDKQSMLRQSKIALTTLQGHISEQRRLAATAASSSVTPSGEVIVVENEDEISLRKVEKHLGNLLLKYTEQHPDVIKTQSMLERLKIKIANTTAENKIPLSTPENRMANQTSPSTPILTIQQKMQLSQLKNEISTIKSDISKINENVKSYEKQVEDTPKREQELLSLKRDYANINGVYSSLMDRKLEAELAVNMEKKQKGEQFRILDHARIPEKPVTPNVEKLLIFSMAAGLGLGGAIIFLLEMFDGSIRREEDIETELGLKVLASISPLRQARDILKQRIDWFFFVLTTMYAGVVLCIFVVLNMKGINKVIVFVRSFI